MGQNVLRLPAHLGDIKLPGLTFPCKGHILVAGLAVVGLIEEVFGLSLIHI